MGVQGRAKLAAVLVAAAVVALTGGCFGGGGDQPPSDVNDETVTMIHDGMERRYHLRTPPPNATDDDTVPLVVVLHGGGGTGARVSELTDFDTVADSEGFFVAYPDGENGWNDGRKVPNRPQNDDLGFLVKAIERTVERRNVDSNRVYVTGVSNGAMMSQRLACERPDLVRGVGAVAGATMPESAPECAQRGNVSVVLIHGTDDRLVPYKGGGVGFVGRRGSVRSVNETVEAWTERNGCSEEATTRFLPDKVDDGTSVRSRSYADCERGSVRLYTVHGGGHGWPDNTQTPVRRILTGDPGREIDATRVVWRFFEEQI